MCRTFHTTDRERLKWATKVEQELKAPTEGDSAVVSVGLILYNKNHRLYKDEAGTFVVKKNPLLLLPLI